MPPLTTAFVIPTWEIGRNSTLVNRAVLRSLYRLQFCQDLSIMNVGCEKVEAGNLLPQRLREPDPTPVSIPIELSNR